MQGPLGVARGGSLLWMQTMSDFSGSPAEMRPAPCQTLSVTLPLAAEGIALVLSNEYGKEPLRLRRVVVGAVDGGRPVTFDGREAVSIAPGQRVVSDALACQDVLPGCLTVSIEPEPGQVATTLGGAFDRTAVDGGSCDPTGRHPRQLFYYGLSAVIGEGVAPQATACFFGDSLVNQGYVSGAATRFLWEEIPGAVTFNCGISGNRLLRAGSGDSSWARSFGRAGVERFTRDVTYGGTLSPNAIFSLIGVNDLYQAERSSLRNELPNAQDLIAAYERIEEAARGMGSALLLGTIPPFRGSVNREKPAWDEKKEALRQEANAWLRDRPHTVDVDALVRSGDDPTRLDERFDCGDHLHFNPAGGCVVGAEICRSMSDMLKR